MLRQEFAFRDALVYANAIPFGRIIQPGEVRTDQEGWATMTITPTRLLPLANGYLLTMFVRARNRATTCSPASRRVG